jgi:hypothetical protein
MRVVVNVFEQHVDLFIVALLAPLFLEDVSEDVDGEIHGDTIENVFTFVFIRIAAITTFSTASTCAAHNVLVEVIVWCLCIWTPVCVYFVVVTVITIAVFCSFWGCVDANVWVRCWSRITVLCATTTGAAKVVGGKIIVIVLSTPFWVLPVDLAPIILSILVLVDDIFILAFFICWWTWWCWAFTWVFFAESCTWVLCGSTIATAAQVICNEVFSVVLSAVGWIGLVNVAHVAIYVATTPRELVHLPTCLYWEFAFLKWDFDWLLTISITRSWEVRSLEASVLLYSEL